MTIRPNDDADDMNARIRRRLRRDPATAGRAETVEPAPPAPDDSAGGAAALAPVPLDMNVMLRAAVRVRRHRV